MRLFLNKYEMANIIYGMERGRYTVVNQSELREIYDNVLFRLKEYQKELKKKEVRR